MAIPWLLATLIADDTPSNTDTMALYQRRDAAGRTRFLLALTLSTLTAIAVAAPLAIEAVQADEPTFTADGPNGGGADDVALPDRSLDTSGGDLGGIDARPHAKGQGQTSKSDEPGSPTTTPEPAPADETALTNPETEPTTTVPDTTTTTDPAAPTDPTDPGDTTTTTEDPDATTTTTDDETTSSSGPSTSLGEQETTTTTEETTTSTSEGGEETTTSTSQP